MNDYVVEPSYLAQLQAKADWELNSLQHRLGQEVEMAVTAAEEAAPNAGYPGKAAELAAHVAKAVQLAARLKAIQDERKRRAAFKTAGRLR